MVCKSRFSWTHFPYIMIKGRLIIHIQMNCHKANLLSVYLLSLYLWIKKSESTSSAVDESTAILFLAFEGICMAWSTFLNLTSVDRWLVICVIMASPISLAVCDRKYGSGRSSHFFFRSCFCPDPAKYWLDRSDLAKECERWYMKGWVVSVPVMKIISDLRRGCRVSIPSRC